MADNAKLNKDISLSALYFPITKLEKNSVPSDTDDDIMEIQAALKELEMKKRLKLAKQMHKNPVYHSEKSGWITTIEDDNFPGGKRKIRKSTEEKLWEALAAWYLDNPNKDLSLAEIYELWLDWKRTPSNTANINRLQISWDSYYANEPLSQELINKPLRKLTSMELRNWAENLLKKHYPVNNKKFSRMFQILNECYEYAADEDVNIVKENLWTRAKKKINKSLITVYATPSDETQVFSNEERRQMKQMVYDDLIQYSNRPTSAGLQILFLFETGLRIGECCGLKWSDVKNGRLYIQRQADNEGVKEWTKTTNGYRNIPLTKEALSILEDVRKYNEEHNHTAEWIFQSDNPAYDYRLSYDSANNKLRKLCIRLGTEIKTVHKIRKTTLSTLLDSPGISNRTVQRFAGHSDITTTQRYYNFERRSQEEQAKAIDEALSL